MPFCVTVSISVFKKISRHLSVCWDTWIHSATSCRFFFLRSVLILSSHLFFDFFELFFSFRFLYKIILRISVIFHTCYVPHSVHPLCFSYTNYIGKTYLFPTGFGIVTSRRLASLLQLQRAVLVLRILNFLNPTHLGHCVSYEYLKYHRMLP